jgi:hypothetical protein
MGMMREVIFPVSQHVCEYRKGTKPLTQNHVALSAARETAVRTVVHEDSEAELTRADHHDGENVRERIWEDRDQRHRSQNDAPSVNHEDHTLPLGALA